MDLKMLSDGGNTSTLVKKVACATKRFPQFFIGSLIFGVEK